MTILISLFLTQVQNSIPNMTTAEAITANRYQQIKQAVIDYSRIKPDTVVTDLAGDGGKYYLISSLAGYSDQFSRITRIQYPSQAISADETPVYLSPEDWDEDYYDASNRYLFFPNHAPATGETARITYNGLYDWTASVTTTAVAQSAHGFSVNDYIYLDSSSVWVTAGSNANLLATHKVSAVADSSNFTAAELQTDIPEMDFFAICNRAACLLCTEVAAQYSRTSDSTILADSVNHPTRASEFGKRAKEFCARWEEAMGLEDDSGKFGESVGDNKPMSDWVALETPQNWPDRGYIFH